MVKAMVVVKAAKSKKIACLFDTGSEVSMMTKRLAEQIGAKLVQRHPVRIKQAMTTVDVETWSTTVNLEFDNQCSDVKFLVGNDFSHPVRVAGSSGYGKDEH